jgi:hypothetical protein
MYRFLYLAQRRPDLNCAEFQQRWRAHAQLAATCHDVLAEIRGYRQWQVIEPGADGVVGVAETRCADAAAIYRMLECAGTREVLQPDELRFLAVPCREAGLVADEVMLRTADNVNIADAAGAFGCLWLAPRPSSVRGNAEEQRCGTKMCGAMERRVEHLQVLLQAATNDSGGELSLGRRDVADELSVFDTLLFARFHEAAVAKAVALAWRLAAKPGEKVLYLQRPPREPMLSELPR